MKKIQSIRDLRKFEICREALLAVGKFPTLAAFWTACERADWMMCILVQCGLLDQLRAVKLASTFAKRTPTRICHLWLSRVKECKGNADAAGDAWAASYASAHTVAYAHPDHFDDVFASEMRWQAGQIRKIMGNPFRGASSRLHSSKRER
jgi:hypothetical protein